MRARPSGTSRMLPGSSRHLSLSKHLPGYRPFDDAFNYCFNSYYESQGPRQPRPKRGVLTTAVERARARLRAHVDEALGKLFARGVEDGSEVARLIEIGINHEQQHQELLLTDILALFAANPLRPAYRVRRPRTAVPEPGEPGWIGHPGGIRQVGHDGNGFAWDNEAPRHDVLIHPFRLADRLVTNGEWLQFMADGGYRTADAVAGRRLDHRQPRGLGGAALLGAARRPVARHVAGGPAAGRTSRHPSATSATTRPTPSRAGPASACRPSSSGRSPRMGCPWRATRWRPARSGRCRPGRRLAHRARCSATSGSGRRAPISPTRATGRPDGALGEYNGKFMVSQQVLRGGIVCDA